MSSSPSFSVIIPARNAAATIERCLDSIEALQIKPAEIIVVDDASSDETGRLAQCKGARVIRKDRNVGPGLARNAGASMATSDFLAFTDSDCTVPPDWLNRFAAALSDGQYCAVTGPYAGATDSKLLSRLIDLTLRHSQRGLPNSIQSTISSNLCVRRKDFELAGGFPAYKLPLSQMCYWGNEDEELGHLLWTKTGKPIRWCPDNGVYHGYRPSIRKYFRQQAKYAEAILISYARFPSMLSGTSNYSRGGGASKVLTAWLALASIAAAPFTIFALAGILPFLVVNLECVADIRSVQNNAGDRLAYTVLCYPFLFLNAIAWTKGLFFGAIKAAAGLLYWSRRPDAVKSVR